MALESRITSVENVPADSSFLFTVRDDDGENREAILVALADGPGSKANGASSEPHSDGGIAGWLNYCQHFTHIKLDKGSGAEMRDGEIVCTNHGAYFEEDTGVCTYGPCEGAYLETIEIETRNGDVFLVDEDYEFVRPGPMDSDPTDLASKSNFEF
jgi:nitrite reductase/ring-hydroxylating ferredoxin subunit